MKKIADEILIDALAEGSTQKTAARLASVSDRTVRRRLDDPTFVERLEAARQSRIDRLAETRADLDAGMVDAVATLRELTVSGSPTVRLGAANALLNHGRAIHKEVDVERRLAELEALIADINETDAATNGGQWRSIA